MEKQLKKILLDFDKRKEKKGLKISLDEAVNEIELLVNIKVENLEKQIKLFKEIESQINFMLTKKLEELNKE